MEPLVVERVYNAPTSKVWKAITDRDQMSEWYFDLKSFRAEVGFEFEFNGGDGNKTFRHLCKITEVIPGQKLTYSWQYDGEEGISYVTFELFSEENDRTRLRLTHTGLETFPNKPEFARKNFEQGWNEIIGTSLPTFLSGARS